MAEIGFNAGHSAVLFALAAQGKADFTFYDINQHAYMMPCFRLFKSTCPDVSSNMVQGDSRQTLSKVVLGPEAKYDLFHVDGGHEEGVFKIDMENALRLTKKGGIIIVDDTNVPYINTTVDLLISAGIVEDITYRATTGYEHRIVRLLRDYV